MGGAVMGHTPGPWLIRTNGTSTGRGPEVYVDGPHYDDGSNFVIADCGCSEATNGGRRWKRKPDADVIEANARLISAAPELLEALKAAVKDCRCNLSQRFSGHLVDCFAPAALEAIAKAEGKSEVRNPISQHEYGMDKVADR